MMFSIIFEIVAQFLANMLGFEAGVSFAERSRRRGLAKAAAKGLPQELAIQIQGDVPYADPDRRFIRREDGQLYSIIAAGFGKSLAGRRLPVEDIKTQGPPEEAGEDAFFGKVSQGHCQDKGSSFLLVGPLPDLEYAIGVIGNANSSMEETANA